MLDSKFADRISNVDGNLNLGDGAEPVQTFSFLLTIWELIYGRNHGM
jgi:hypothetical protein